MAKWYLTRDGQEFGPLSSDQLRMLATKGRLRPDSLVRREGMTQPKAAAKIIGLVFAAVQEPHSPVVSGSASEATESAAGGNERPEAEPVLNPSGEPASAGDAGPTVTGRWDEVVQRVGPKASVVAASMLPVLLLFWNAEWDVFRWYWYWAACCLVIPAAVHPQSLGSFGAGLLEVLLRSVLFLIVGFFGGAFIGIGLDLLLDLSPSKAFPIGAVTATLPLAALPPNLTLLGGLVAGGLHLLNAAGRGPRGGLCRRCEGTGYCYVCRGQGRIEGGECPACFSVGRCRECSGTGYGATPPNLRRF